MAADESRADVKLDLIDVGRRFGRRTVFQGLSAEVKTGQTLVIAGANGSGKSTLMKIIAGLLPSSSGRVEVAVDGMSLNTQERRRSIGFVSPDLTLYAELTGAENLQFFGRLNGLSLTRDELITLFERVGLKGRGRDYVRSYSSGMRQRLKYAFALLHRPAILLLDEPTMNLDAQGVQIVQEIVASQKRRGMVVIATNEPREVAWGDVVVRLES